MSGWRAITSRRWSSHLFFRCSLITCSQLVNQESIHVDQYWLVFISLKSIHNQNNVFHNFCWVPFQLMSAEVRLKISWKSAEKLLKPKLFKTINHCFNYERTLEERSIWQSRKWWCFSVTDMFTGHNSRLVFILLEVLCIGYVTAWKFNNFYARV